MKRYEPSTPSVKMALTAAALAATTMIGLVVLPAELDSVAEADTPSAVSDAATTAAGQPGA